MARSLFKSRSWALSLCFLALIPPHSAGAGDPGSAGPSAEDEANYDVLDGHGASGKKVDVVEWDGNLEIHVTPRGSLKGLSLKLDNRDKNKPVMVIGYRFKEHPQTRLIRRAILGISIHEGFKAFLDPTEPDYDKVIITMNGLGDPLVAYRLDSAPDQLYPDPPPSVAKSQAKPDAQPDTSASTDSGSRSAPSRSTASVRPAKAPPKGEDTDDSDGTIRPFFVRPP